MKNLKLLFLTIILVCSVIIAILSLSDLIDANPGSYKYVFATECLTLCLIVAMVYLVKRENREDNSND